MSVPTAIRRALSVDPNQRFPTMNALLAALDPPARKHGRRRPIAAIAVAALAVAGAAAYLLLD